MFSDYLTDWLDRLERENTNIPCDFIALRSIMNSLTLKHPACPVITVGGTNGKGSTVALLESMYHAAGYRVGAFTSPHLLQYNERIRIDQTPVSDASLIAAFKEIHRVLEGRSCSYFAWTFLAALFIFQNTSLDVIILEVGLGGRLDPTNLIDADLAIITSIDLDHCEILGNTREKIALEKAGIFRSERRAVLGERHVPFVLEAFAEEKKVPLSILGRDFEYEFFEDHWCWMNADVKFTQLPKPTLYLENAATALMAVIHMQNALPVSTHAIKLGLQRATLQGRLQWISRNPNVLLDVSHNPEAASLLADELQACLFGGIIHAIFAVQARKDIRGMIDPLLPHIHHWHVCPLQGIAGSADPAEIASILNAKGTKQVTCYPEIQQAYQTLVTNLAHEDAVIVFGSFHAVKEVLIFY